MGQLSAPANFKIGTQVISGTVGSVLFIGAGGLVAQDNVNLFWDDTNNRLSLGVAAEFGFGAAGVPDVKLARDGANILAQRNGLNAQTFSVYSTYTSAANNERLDISGNTIYAAANGAGIPNLSVFASGPSLFLGAGNSTEWEITATELSATNDNTYDIGQSNLKRPRTIYIGTSIQIEADQGLRLTNQVSGAAAAGGTLNNAPAAGNPTFWTPIFVNGGLKYFPCW
jgi:hypothetical protein